MKYIRIFILALLSLLVSCDTKKDIPVNVEDPEPKRKFTKIIERISANDFEKNLIFNAESIYPICDSVIAYASPHLVENILENNCWFFEDFDGVLIPFAITSAGIEYYDSLIDTITAGNKYKFMINATFEYHAEIEFKETYTFEGNNLFTNEPLPSVSYDHVYIVSMSLKWSHYCGPVCGLWISHQRLVVFDELGNFLNVFYDGPIPIIVS